jgi:hypothetical protein
VGAFFWSKLPGCRRPPVDAVMLGLRLGTLHSPSITLPSLLLATAVASPLASPRSSPFGIGAYFPPGQQQISAAAELVGHGGWVLILIPCGNVTSETPLPVRWANFDSSAMMLDAYARGLKVVVRLEPQYSAMRPFTPCWNGPSGPAGGPGGVVGNGTCPWVLPDGSQGCHENTDCHLRRLADPGSKHMRYEAVSESYARVAASLPLPPDGSKLHVQIGNELNLAWSCPCDDPELVVMTMSQLAAEAAAFSRDALAALRKVKRLSVAITPIAPIGLQARPCCSNISQCEEVASAAAKPQCRLMRNNSISFTCLSFEKLLLQAEPQLYSKVDWFSAHSYPCAVRESSGSPVLAVCIMLRLVAVSDMISIYCAGGDHRLFHDTMRLRFPTFSILSRGRHSHLHLHPCLSCTQGDGSGGPKDGCGLGGDPRPGTNGWNAPFSVSRPWLLAYQNETRLVGRVDVPVIITETGWSRDFCTEEQRAVWQVSAWEAWNADSQVVAVTPFNLEGPRIAGFAWLNASGARLPVFTETVALRCRLYSASCKNCLTVRLVAPFCVLLLCAPSGVFYCCACSFSLPLLPSLQLSR